MSKSRLVIFIEALEKGAPLPVGTRKIHGMGTPKAQWVKKGGDGKWHYDGMVTPKDVKDWEDEQARKKRLGKMKTNMAQKKADADKKGAGAATPVDADRPSDAELDKAPRKTQLYWKDASDPARDLCDMTGVLCLNKEAEEYVTENLNSVFKMTKDQETEFKKIMPDIPMGSDGKWLDDPLFLEDALTKMKELRDEMKTRQYKDHMKRELARIYSSEWNVRDDAWRTTFVNEKIIETEMAVVQWVRMLEAHENDKRLLDKASEIDYNLRGAQVLGDLPAALLGAMASPENLTVSKWNKYSELTKESRDFLELLGVSAAQYDSHAMESGDWYYYMLGMISPKFGKSVVKPWMEKFGDKYDAVGGGIPGGGGMPFYWDEYEQAGAKLRTKFPAIAKFFETYVEVPAVQYDMDRRMQEYSARPLDFYGLRPFVNTEVSSNRDPAIFLKRDATWRDIANDLKSLMRAKTVKWDQAVITNGTTPRGMSLFNAIIDTGRELGKTYVDTLETSRAVTNKYHECLDQMTPELRYCFTDIDDFARCRTGSPGPNMTSSMSHRAILNPSSLYGDGIPEQSGMMVYREGKKASMAVRPSRRRRWGSGSQGTGGWVPGDRKRATFGSDVEALSRNILRGKFHKSVASISRYDRYTPETCRTHPGASLMYAVGANWQVRAMAKKSRLAPDWTWGHFKPYTTGNPVEHGSLEKLLDGDVFRQQVTTMRNEQLAVTLGMKKKGARTMPVIALKGTGQAGRDEWLKKIKADWTHGHGYSAGYGSDRVKVKAVFDIQYHDYYADYKNEEQAKGNTQYLYHGTDFQAGSSIIKGGFKIMSNTKAGRLLGDGVYFAKSSSKSAQYLASRSFSNTSGESGVMLACRVAMGKVSPGASIDEKYDKQWDTTCALKGMPFGGRTMQHDEWCVRNPKAVVPVQWIDVSI